METLRCERILRPVLSVVMPAIAALWAVTGPVCAAPVHHAIAHQAATHQAAAHQTARSAAPGPSAGGWTPTACGREPAAPTVATGTIAQYNASIDAVTAYDQAARSFNACVSRTATAEQTAISAEAKRRIDTIQSVSEAVQRRIAANFTVLGAALKKAPPSR